MQQFLEMMKSWNPLGQGLFVIIIAGVIGYTISYVCYVGACTLLKREPRPPLQ